MRRLESTMEPFNLDAKSYLAKFQSDIASHISDFRNVLRTIEDDSYIARSKNQSLELVVNIEASGANFDKSSAVRRTTRRHFLSIVTTLITYIDWILTLKKAQGKPIPGVKSDNSSDEISLAVGGFLQSEYRRIAEDRRLTNPKKVSELGIVEPWVNEFLLSLFAIRRALEHHSDIPDTDITVKYRRTRLTIGSSELTKVPMLIEGGSNLSIEIIEEPRRFNKDELILLEELDLECLFFTLQTLVGPALIRYVR